MRDWIDALLDLIELHAERHEWERMCRDTGGES